MKLVTFILQLAATATTFLSPVTSSALEVCPEIANLGEMNRVVKQLEKLPAVFQKSDDNPSCLVGMRVHTSFGAPLCAFNGQFPVLGISLTAEKSTGRILHSAIAIPYDGESHALIVKEVQKVTHSLSEQETPSSLLKGSVMTEFTVVQSTPDGSSYVVVQKPTDDAPGLQLTVVQTAAKGFEWLITKHVGGSCDPTGKN